MAIDQTYHKHILDDDRIFFPEDPEMRIFGSVEKLAQWRHRNRGPAFIRIGRRIGLRKPTLSSANCWRSAVIVTRSIGILPSERDSQGLG